MILFSFLKMALRPLNNKLSIAQKIGLNIAVLMFFSLALGVLAWARMANASKLAHKISDEYLLESQISAEVANIALEIKGVVTQFSSTGDTELERVFTDLIVKSNAKILEGYELAGLYPEDLDFLKKEMDVISA